MKIVIVGAGFTGVQLAKLLVDEKNTVTLIDNDEDIVRHTENRLDCTVVFADGNSLETLENCGISKADALVCVTSSDEVNMITCSLVDAVYPEILKIARVRNYAYYLNSEKAEKRQVNLFSGKHRPLYGINYMIHPDVEAADAIVQAVENGVIGRVISFDNSELEIVRLSVEVGSDFDGISLKEIRTKTETKFLVAYVEQNGKTSLPSGNTVINAGDILGILVSKREVHQLLALCGTQKQSLKKVALIGAGRIGSIVAEKLIPKKKNAFSKLFSGIKTNNAQDFVIIDSNDVLAKSASEKFPEARVMCADASDENFLREEGIIKFDLAICATRNHEMNMVLAAYLESLGVKQSISLVSSAAFATIADKLGIDVSVPLRDVVVDSIMSHLRGKSVKEIHTVTDGLLEIVECEVGSHSKFAGKNFARNFKSWNLSFIDEQKLGLDEFKIAGGNTVIYPGNHVVLIAEAENSGKILSYFAGSSD